MSNKALLIAIVAGMLVLCVIVGVIANGVIRANENIEIAKELVAYCSASSGKTVDECQSWTTDILMDHRDKVVACRNDIQNGMPACIAALGLQP